jgi:FkbM family methyltransferase|tara:strand:- start:340 stop:1014 length:675 start_codon:yes stop_codon:yes gene_type:complete
MKKTKQKISWDQAKDVATSDFLAHEVFELDSYEHIYSVQEGDVVLDLGASLGPFTWKIMDKASKVYTVEPMIDLIPTIKKNTEGFPVTIINAALSHNNGEIEFTDDCVNNFKPKMVRTVDFKTLLKENNIDKIDFIKTDCEGGEYALISNVNLPWIKENVRNIVGEWHVGKELEQIEFKYFRDKFLPQFKNFEIYSIDSHNIKWDLYNDHFLEHYTQILIHIEV